MGYRLGQCDTDGIPLYLIKPLLEQYKIPALCELGTGGGASTMAAVGLFQKIWTIELISNRANIDLSFPSITWLTGHSVDHLHNIIDELIREKQEETKYVMFWIDSHYSDNTPNTSEWRDCYLLEELEVIARYPDAVIFVDDARLFLGSTAWPNDARHFPGIQDIFVALKSWFPNHYATLTDDYIICVPGEMKEALDTEWRANYNVRYPDAATKLKTQVKGAYDAFLNYLK